MKERKNNENNMNFSKMKAYLTADLIFQIHVVLN